MSSGLLWTDHMFIMAVMQCKELRGLVWVKRASTLMETLLDNSLQLTRNGKEITIVYMTKDAFNDYGKD